MKIEKFEDILAWQKAQDMAVEIFTEFEELNQYSYKDQIFRASLSISNNIAEGFDRQSNAEFSRFLYIAIASNSEVRSMLHLGFRLKFIDKLEKINL